MCLWAWLLPSASVYLQGRELTVVAGPYSISFTVGAQRAEHLDSESVPPTQSMPASKNRARIEKNKGKWNCLLKGLVLKG